MNKMEVDPAISRFVIFSGGGGLINREMEINLEQGQNKLMVKGIPASFDPETFNVTIEDEEVKLREIIIKKPNRQYVEDSLKREASAAYNLISSSKDIGAKRKDILDICEDISLRTYLDEEVYLLLWVESVEKKATIVKLSYFIDDDRFSWKPTITIDQDPDGETVEIQGLIAIKNESAVRFENVEVKFADFAKDFQEGSENYRAKPAALKKQMRKSKMNVMLF